MSKELISVIVPVYNIKDYLEKCITSVCNQSYTNLEILLVDDGSTDGSGELCDVYGEKDRRVKVLHKTNGGLSSARNYGMEWASGDYLIFVDGDDYLDENFVKELYQTAVQTGAELVMSRIIAVEEGKLTEQFVNDLPDKAVLTRAEAMKRLASTVTVSNCAWNKLYQRKLWEKIRFPEGTNYEDKYVMHEIFGQCEQIALARGAVYYYVQRPESISNLSFSEKNLDEIIAGNVKLRYYKENYPQYLGDAKANVCLRALESYIRAIRCRAGKDTVRIIGNTVWKNLNAFLLCRQYPFRLKLHLLARFFLLGLTKRSPR